MVIDKLIKAAEEGKGYRVDLVTKSIYIGKEPILLNGVADEELCEDIENKVEFLSKCFEVFYTSIPPRRDKGNFIGKPMDKLSDLELIRASPRRVARAVLEGYLCCFIIGGMKYEGEGFFWKISPNFIVFKKWFN